jgi:23S rRNA (pseudouridine1915-N3)-methyltransferase
MLKLKVISIGKTKESWLEEGLSEYTKRLKPQMNIEWIWAKDNHQLTEFVNKESLVICLDPAGELYTSEQFASFFDQRWQQGGSRLAIVIGGADGLPSELKNKHPLISLSRLTFTHQMTRLVLIEQLYRALEIKKGSQYHK